MVAAKDCDESAFSGSDDDAPAICEAIAKPNSREHDFIRQLAARASPSVAMATDACGEGLVPVAGGLADRPRRMTKLLAKSISAPVAGSTVKSAHIQAPPHSVSSERRTPATAVEKPSLLGRVTRRAKSPLPNSNRKKSILEGAVQSKPVPSATTNSTTTLQLPPGGAGESTTLQPPAQSKNVVRMRSTEGSRFEKFITNNYSQLQLISLFRFAGLDLYTRCLHIH